MNTTQFTNGAWDGQKIDCAINNIFYICSGENDYAAQAVVVSTRPIYKSTKQSAMLTISDPNWSFRYVPNQAMYANQATFDPLTRFLDFYANMIIGFDWETWADLGGNPYFKKAFNILNLGVGSPFKKVGNKAVLLTADGDYVRIFLMTSTEHFRESFFVYHYGLDEYQIRKKDAQDKIVNLITVLEDMQKKTGINSVLIKQFFDTKNGEIIDLLRIILIIKYLKPKKNRSFSRSKI